MNNAIAWKAAKAAAGFFAVGALLVGCSGQNSAQPGDVITEQGADGVVSIRSADGVDVVSSGEEVIPGEALSQESVAAKCNSHNLVYVQWCDAPSKDVGTVCRLHAGCSLSQAAINECVADAYTVCGTPKQPWYIYP